MAADSVTAEIERRAEEVVNQRTKEPCSQPELSPAPFKSGDVVCLKSGGFAMTVVDCGWVSSCCGPEAYWSAEVVYSGWDADKGLVYDDICCDLLKPSRPGRLHSPEDDMPF